MRYYFLLFAALFASAPIGAEAAPADPTRQIVIYAMRALDFNQGDIGTLMDAREDFTAVGWDEFMKYMKDFLDSDGKPQFSSEFSPSGDPVTLSHENGIIHVTIPGKLKQTHNHSSTTYTVIIDVEAKGDPVRIEHLVQKICGGNSTTPCQ